MLLTKPDTAPVSAYFAEEDQALVDAAERYVAAQKYMRYLLDQHQDCVRLDIVQAMAPLPGEDEPPRPEGGGGSITP